MAIFKELFVLDTPGHTLVKAKAAPLPPSQAAQIKHSPKPAWLRTRLASGPGYLQIKSLLEANEAQGRARLHTVCEEAHCPNLAECWDSGTATIMLGGDTCTRACRFCAIKTARTPPPLDPLEPEQVALSLASLGLKYVVLTSVDRDDLEDGGAGHFAQTIKAIKRLCPGLFVEALVPDFQSDSTAIETIVHSGVDVYAHNLETVRSLQSRVRDPRANYNQSLKTLYYAKNFAKGVGQRLITKSSLMLGLGEKKSELKEAFQDLRDAGVEVLTLGQYLRPSLSHLPVESYLSPEEFNELKEEAQRCGFILVAAGPMVRSSYRASELLIKGILESRQTLS